MDEMTLTLSSPITEEQFDAITDVDFDNTDRIWFHTKHGKDVEFVKRKKGKWKYIGFMVVECTECHAQLHELECTNYCPNCGALMEGQDERDI